MNDPRRRILLIASGAVFVAGLTLAIVGVIGLAGGLGDSNGSVARPPSSPSQRTPTPDRDRGLSDVSLLLVSSSPDRSDPEPLDGATVSDEIYVFTSPDIKATEVTFFLDGAPTFVVQNQEGPYDFLGGTSAAANPFNTAMVTDGAHTISAEVTLAAGGTTTLRSAFEVLNATSGAGIELLVSLSPDRSNPVPLERLTVSGDVYVFAKPTVDVTEVRFFLDDAPVYVVEGQHALYDFLGGSPDVANPLNTRMLPDGPHSISAEFELKAGGTEMVGSAFTVLAQTVVADTTTPPARLTIGAIGVDAPIINLGLDATLTPEVPSTGFEVAWYDFSAKPGAGSNVVLAGHVTWDKAPAVFWSLGELSPGTSIGITTREGLQMDYVVTENLLVDPDDPDAVEYMYPTGKEKLTLITCGGTFLPNPSERFGGDYTHRTVVVAEPVVQSG